MLTSALEHYRRQQEFTAAALAAANNSRRDLRELTRLIAILQVLAAQDAADSVEVMLAEQRIDAPPAATVDTASFAGFASDGRPLSTLFEQASNTFALGLMAVTTIQDTARMSAGAGIASRPGVGWTRMLNPPSCSRCVILAGRFYRWSDGFLRHPKCDCRHIPTTENLSGDLTTNPRAYYDSLDEAGRLKFAGSRANLRAIEDGADLNQVVNISRRGRSGIATAQDSPLQVVDGVKTTTAGSTVRSWTFQQQVGLGLRPAVRADGVTRRIMPESIYALAHSRDEALQLLKANGWITDLPARQAGRAALDATRRVERNERARARRARQREDAVAATPDLEALREIVRRTKERRRAS